MKKRKEIKISKKNKKAGKNINNKFLILFQNIINRIRLYTADTANFKVIAGIATVAVIVCIYGIIAVSGAFIKISPATPSSADMAVWSLFRRLALRKSCWKTIWSKPKLTASRVKNR